MYMIGVKWLPNAVTNGFIFFLIGENQNQVTSIFENTNKFSKNLRCIGYIFNEVTAVHIIIGIIGYRYFIFNYITRYIYFILPCMRIRLRIINTIAIYFFYFIAPKANIASFTNTIGQYPFTYLSCFRRMLKLNAEPSG